ncbi:hypothetical protein [Nostoc sp.]|uniref:hypothetical protein n=1 Tax=Nostoc sp. TaxID=1180 RepID=UPI002FFCC7BD
MEILEAISNGTKTPLSAEEKPKKDKRKRNLPILQAAAAIADMNSVDYSGLADRTGVQWDSLKNYEMFSLSADGSFPLMKVSRSKAVRLADREVIMVGGGVCFRVSLSNHPNQNKPQS